MFALLLSKTKIYFYFFMLSLIQDFCLSFLHMQLFVTLYTLSAEAKNYLLLNYFINDIIY